MKYLNTYGKFTDVHYKVFESNVNTVRWSESGIMELERDIKDYLLELEDDGLYTTAEYRPDLKPGLSKQKDRWKAVPGTYISVHISNGEYSMENPNPFKFTKKIYETILDIHQYVEDRFKVTEDGYNIEYYFETINIKEPIDHYWDEDSDYTWRVNEPIEDSFYSIDEFKDFADKYDMDFAYISFSYKLK